MDDLGETAMRILLADDQPKVRFALRTLLERKLGFEIVGEAGDFREMWQQVKVSCPDLLLLDWELPGPKVLDLMSALHAICPDLQVIVLSGHPEMRQAAMEAGVDAFVCKCDPPESLLAAIEDIALNPARTGSTEEIDGRGTATEV
jgi:DNA-binding NarL/FixJ family response regulator